jgi:long-chain acyl-CoA synthetase
MNVAVWSDRQLERCDDLDALVHEDLVLTSHSVHDMSCRFASALLALDITPGTRVVLWLPNVPELVIAFSGVIRAGSVSVVVSDASPSAEVAQIIAMCTARVVVTTSRLAAVGAAAIASADRLIIVGAGDAPPTALRFDALVGEHLALVMPVDRAAEDLAQIVCTSGTTGTLKGVVWTHDTIENRWRAFHDDVGLYGPHIRCVCPLPMSSAYAAELLYLRTIRNVTLVLIDRFDPVRFLATVERQRIESAWLVPAMCEALLALPSSQRADLSSLASLRVGGSAVSASLVKRFHARYGVQISTVYGMTELGVLAQSAPGDDSGALRVRPGLNVRVVDGDREASAGDVGEIEFQAGGMRAQYYGEPAAPSGEWFRTGDLGRLDLQGALHLAGRSKELIIQGGINIYPQQIVEAINLLVGVADCAVIGVPDHYLGEVVVACVVRQSSAALTVDDVLAHCREHIDARRLPGRVQFVDALPRNALGKVKLQELRDSVIAAASAVVYTELFVRLKAATPDARSALLADTVVAALRQALPTAKGQLSIDRDTAFGECGLTSMGAVQLAHALGLALGRPLPATLTFRFPTVGRLAEGIAELVDADGTSANLETLRFSRTGKSSCRATIGQEYFWYLAKDDPDPTSYYTLSTFVLEGTLDLDALRQSFAELVSYHEAFRTVFREVDGYLHQFVLAADAVAAVELEYVDDVKAEIERIPGELLSRGFDLTRARNLVLARVAALAPDRYALVLLFHHIVMDAGGNASFVTHLFDGYARLRNGSKSSLPTNDLPLQYIDYADAQVRWSQTATGRRNSEFWAAQLRGASPLELPVDFPRDPVETHRNTAAFGITADLNYPAEYVQLPEAGRNAVARAAEREHTTPYVVYMTALGWLFHERSGQDDLCIQTTYNARGSDRVLDAIQGPIVAWTLMRLRYGGGPTFRELIGRTKQIVESALDHGLIHDYYQRVPHGLRRAVFNYLPISVLGTDLRASDLVVIRQQQTFPRWKRTWDLHLTLLDLPDRTTWVWTGFEQLFRRETVSALLQRYIEILVHAAD